MSTRTRQSANTSPEGVPTTTPSPMFLTLDELCWELRISRTKALKLIRAIEIPSLSIGDAGLYRIPRASLVAWQERKTTAERLKEKEESPARSAGLQHI